MTKNCHTKTFLMKKITSLLAIAAVALTAALSFGSCSKNDDPAVEPEPEDKILPIDSIVATLLYDYSETALQLFDLKYEVTDFNGQTETFTVTEPGHTEKVYKTADLNATANIKLHLTYKNNIDEVIKADSAYFSFQSGIIKYISVKGKLFDFVPDTDHFVLMEGVQSKEDIKGYIEYILHATKTYPITYSISLSDDYKKGVTESWFNLHNK